MKTKAGLLLLVTLLAFGLWFFKAEKSTLPAALRNFAVADTGAIDKIFMADKAGNKVLLERKGPGVWLVNKKFAARSDVMNNLLLTVHSLEVKMPCPDAAHNTVVAKLAAIAVKTEIYIKGHLYKTYFVGGPTQDLLGTYMLLEKSERVFIMHIPGFNGFLSTRYTPFEENWKERFLFKEKTGTLSAIEISYPEKPEASFYLDLKSGKVGDWKNENQVLLNSLIIRKYENHFQAAPFEAMANDLNPSERKALLKFKPVACLAIYYYSGKQTRTMFYTMPKDPDRLYALAADSSLFIVQHYMFDRILIARSDFKAAPENIYQHLK